MNKNIKVFYLYGSIGIGKTIYAKWLFRDIHFDDIKFVLLDCKWRYRICII